MIKVITYGTYDLLHYGHIRLLERAKMLGDYLIVGVTADDFDKTRGKINVQQSLMERVEAVRATGIADEIIIEEYEGQKIDDIQNYDVDVFTVGSDWEGKFDYLNEYCKVVYLERTRGVSSSELRAEEREIKVGVVANNITMAKKFIRESAYINGLVFSGIFLCQQGEADVETSLTSFESLIEKSDAIYVLSSPETHYEFIKQSLLCNKHVICESPISLNGEQYIELKKIADEREVILFDAIKTAYATAFSRLVLQVKSGSIGDVVSIDTICTSIDFNYIKNGDNWNSIYSWGPIALLPIFKILGTTYLKKIIATKLIDSNRKFDLFTSVCFIYENAIANIKVGKGIKSEGQLIISGTKGYIYVPSPWWKTDYYEIRYENANDNKRFFYKLDGEGIREELVTFLKLINGSVTKGNVESSISLEICNILNCFNNGEVFKLGE